MSGHLKGHVSPPFSSDNKPGEGDKDDQRAVAKMKVSVGTRRPVLPAWYDFKAILTKRGEPRTPGNFIGAFTDGPDRLYVNCVVYSSGADKESAKIKKQPRGRLSSAKLCLDKYPGSCC